MNCVTPLTLDGLDLNNRVKQCSILPGVMAHTSNPSTLV